MNTDLKPSKNSSCDLLVIGSGAGGLSTAVTAAQLGLKVTLIEKTAEWGGTTAWSGGWMWIPRNPLAVKAGLLEPLEKPLSYLRHELGEGFNADKAMAYLENGPRMVTFFEDKTALRFIDGNGIPDFHGRTPDAATGGRSVCATPFDGRRLGPHLKDLKPPLYETTLWGMGIASGQELRHFFQSRQSLKSLVYVTKRVVRHFWDVLTHQRGTRLVNGNALVAGLLQSALDLGVDMRLKTPAIRLIRSEVDGVERVTGAWLQGPQGPYELKTRCGVVLATGGFPHDDERLKALLPHAKAATKAQHWSAGARGNTGDGLRLGESQGGVVNTEGQQGAALAPVSLVPQSDGSLAHFPHLIERAKPGLIAVTPQGKRFTNEANSYYDFMQDLLNVAAEQNTKPKAWLLCDHAFLRHYGLGAVKPAPFPLWPWLHNGYLKRGKTWAELAQATGINPHALAHSVARYNTQARDGHDPDFGKGNTPYNRIQGDAARAQAQGLNNPCMGPLENGPFYAVKVVAGSLGTFAGLNTNASAQVLNAEGLVIPGLYATGNDMNSMMAGRYPSGGITLGPAMTFGFIAAHHAAGQQPL